MKKPLPFTGACAVLLTLACSSAVAAAALGPKARIFAEFDANKNGLIDGAEIEAVRKAYAADPKGQFARYDADHDGKLSDQEIATILPPGKGGKKDGEKKGGKKKGDSATPKVDAPADGKAGGK